MQISFAIRPGNQGKRLRKRENSDEKNADY